MDQAKGQLARIASHLVRNRWKLIDVDGKPTRWGRWDPEYFQTDEGKFDRGLQAVELLSFIKTAERWTGDATFTAAYRDLVRLGYPEFTLRARNTSPPDSILHFLDELAFWSYWNLLRYEENPDLRALYRRGYERGHEVVRVEQNAWFNYLYGALTGNDAEAEASAEHLRGWPLDLRIWSYQNSHRTDLRTPSNYVALKGGTRTFPPRRPNPCAGTIGSCKPMEELAAKTWWNPVRGCWPIGWVAITDSSEPQRYRTPNCFGWNIPIFGNREPNPTRVRQGLSGSERMGTVGERDRYGL